MKPSVRGITGIPQGILSAMVVTVALFLSLPLLTQFQPAPSVKNSTESVLINPHKPPPPPSETRDMPEKQSPVRRKSVERDVKPERVLPNVDIPKTSLLGGEAGGIQISITPSIESVAPIPNPTYRPEEVDKQPVLLRAFPFQYPYLAKRDNIEGWVTLQFVVDKDGNVKKVELAAAEPVGFFEEAALKAVERYRFKPAVKNGEAVSCMMTQRIRFDLD